MSGYRNHLVAGTLLGEAEHGIPLRSADFLNRESISLLKEGHTLELGLRPELGEGHVPREALDCVDIHHRPVRLATLAPRIVVRILGVESSMVWISFLHDLDDSHNPGIGATGVIEKGEIALLHLVPHIITRLEVPHPIPVRGPGRRIPEIIEGE